MDSIRIDRWLCAARIYKSRSSASDACQGGHVQINGVVARPSQPVRIGDRVVALAPRGKCVLDVIAIAEKRQSPPRARELYTDHSPPPPARDERVAPRLRGSGRPTKADRRALGRLVGR
jgi:ribosome-associated heat shock protein Hsp15